MAQAAWGKSIAFGTPRNVDATLAIPIAALTGLRIGGRTFYSRVKQAYGSVGGFPTVLQPFLALLHSSSHSSTSWSRPRPQVRRRLH